MLEENENSKILLCSFCKQEVTEKVDRCPSCMASLTRKGSKITAKISEPDNIVIKEIELNKQEKKQVKTIQCKFCGEKISEDAIKCEHCNSNLREKSVKLVKSEKNEMKKIIGIAIIILGFISLILFLKAGLDFNSYGSELTTLRSQGGGSVAEAYYQEIGGYGKAYALFSFGFGIFSLMLSIGIGGYFILSNKEA